MLKLIVILCAFFGALVIAWIFAFAGVYENTSVLTLDNGFPITKALVFAGFVALLAMRKE